MLLPESPEEIRLSMEQRRELYLIFKEALTNLIKYAACSQAYLVIALRHNELQLVVKDNGVGFDPALQNERNGLRNLRKRAESLGGILRIDSAPGKGTRVELNFPLKT
jgi:signal transduction histidine kinase